MPNMTKAQAATTTQAGFSSELNVASLHAREVAIPLYYRAKALFSGRGNGRRSCRELGRWEKEIAQALRDRLQHLSNDPLQLV